MAISGIQDGGQAGAGGRRVALTLLGSEIEGKVFANALAVKGPSGGTSMKRIRFVNTGVLLLLFGITLPIYAKRQQDKDKQQQQRAQQQPQVKPQQQQQQRRAPQQANRPSQQQHAQQQPQVKPQQQQQQRRAPQQANRPSQQQRAQQQSQVKPQQQQQQQRAPQQANRPSQQQQRQQQAAWQGHRASNWQSQHLDWQQRGGYHGYRIPDDRYRGYFGPDHAFRIYSYPVVVGGYPRFQYGGFWFSIVDPWPEYWSDDWYDNDDVYIEYSGDGYYMYDRRYPGVGIAISVSLN